ncbi:16719_t:CDS:2, partial [Racocetra persica]
MSDHTSLPSAEELFLEDGDIKAIKDNRVHAPSILVIPKDISIEIIKQLIQSSDQLPYKSDLTNFLNKNPLVKILLAPNLFYQISTMGPDSITEEEQDTYFILSTEAEYSYYYLWDCIIKNTLELFGMHSASLSTLEFDRNTNKQTSTGKEKSWNEAGDLSSELIDKIKNWTYRDVLYIFAYYAISVQVIFVTLYKSENKKKKLNVCSDQIAEFDLE